MRERAINNWFLTTRLNEIVLLIKTQKLLTLVLWFYMLLIFSNQHEININKFNFFPPVSSRDPCRDQLSRCNSHHQKKGLVHVKSACASYVSKHCPNLCTQECWNFMGGSTTTTTTTTTTTKMPNKGNLNILVWNRLSYFPFKTCR